MLRSTTSTKETDVARCLKFQLLRIVENLARNTPGVKDGLLIQMRVPANF